ncbi:MAG: orotidine-5'-phosphate decarboxylase [Candidatus Gracilibacteria bacterium]|jgi:orotidine-5'-phosphate decarboxylase
MSKDPVVIVALDVSNGETALVFVQKLDPKLCIIKVGKELFTSAGPEVVRTLIQSGFKVFLDLKFHDIPNTVAQAVKAAAELGVWMINVHAFGGRKMMQAAKEALEGFENPPLLIAVTVLTSMEFADLREIGFTQSPEWLVERLALLAKDCGLDGIVCSAQEAGAMRALLGSDFVLVCPGIRRTGDAVNNQARTMTPPEAMQAGASYLVVGRPITKATNPLTVLEEISGSIV